MKDVLDKQSKYLENLDNAAKKDTLIQLLQLREEMKIDKEDAEHLERVKETNKVLNRAVNIDINMAKDVKVATEAVAGKEELERKKQQAETLDKLQKSVDKLNKILDKKEKDLVGKPDNVQSGNKTFGSTGNQTGKSTKNVDISEQPLTAENAGEKLKAKRQVYRDEQAEEGSLLRKILVGQDKKSVFEPMLKKRENAMADKRMAKEEREASIKGAIENDPGTIGVGNFHGNKKWYDLPGRFQKHMAMRKYAGDKYDELKKKEDAVLESQDAVDRSKSFGYAPKQKDLKSLKKASKDYASATENLSQKSQDRADARAETSKAKENSRAAKVEAKEAVTQPATQFAQTSEEKEEGKAERLKFESDTILVESKQEAEMHSMGATLLASLAVQKDMLQAMKEMAANGGGGGFGLGDLLGAGAEAAAGEGMLSRAGKFLLKHGGKLVKGAAVIGGAYEAYSGWNEASEAQESGEITADEANVKKAEAVGGGAGGAAMGIAGAEAGGLAGAEIGGTIGAFFGGVGAIPGAAIGGALGGLAGGAAGYWAGSEIGSGITGTLTKGYQGVRNFFGFKGEEDVPPPPTTTSRTEENHELRWNNGQPTIDGKNVSVKDYTRIFNAPMQDQPALIKNALNAPTAEGSGTANAIENRTVELNNTKDAMNKTGGNNIVAAPVTNISSVNTQNNQTRVPVRSEDNTLNKYIGSRYALF